MSKAAIGARVQYCGHKGWFVADIHHFNGINVVVAGSMVTPVTTDNINRDQMDEVTHHLSDFPSAGYWNPRRGVFVVPENQVTDLSESKKKNAKRIVQNTPNQLPRRGLSGPGS
jgi:hypothetical protein